MGRAATTTVALRQPDWTPSPMLLPFYRHACSIVISAPICVLPGLVSPVTVSGVTLLALMDGTASGGRPVNTGRGVAAIGLRDPR
jgi:hypothetical protein